MKKSIKPPATTRAAHQLFDMLICCSEIMPPNAPLFIYRLLAVNNTPHLIPLLTYLGGNGDR